MMWRNSVFRSAYEQTGHAFFCGKIGYYPVSKETSLIIKTEEDLRLVDHILAGKEQKGDRPIEYDELVRGDGR